MSLELRYTEHKDRYYLTSYMRHGFFEIFKNHDNRPLSERPEWLVNIINIAHIGGHFLEAVDPPPERILWFAVDSDFNLLDINIFGD